MVYKRVSKIIFAAILAVTVFSGCGNRQEEGIDKTEKETTTQKSTQDSTQDVTQEQILWPGNRMCMILSFPSVRELHFRII